MSTKNKSRTCFLSNLDPMKTIKNKIVWSLCCLSFVLQLLMVIVLSLLRITTSDLKYHFVIIKLSTQYHLGVIKHHKILLTRFHPAILKVLIVKQVFRN